MSTSHPVRPALRLRPLRSDDEAAVRAAHDEMRADDFTFALGLEPGMGWAEYLDLLARIPTGVDLPPGLVPATFLVADVGGEVVGRTSIRHRLNDWLAREGGHIGYGVRPAHRRRGYAAAILSQSLVVARAVGVDRVLVTCDDVNAASASVIELAGGVLEGLVPASDDGRAVRRYWIA